MAVTVVLFARAAQAGPEDEQTERPATTEKAVTAPGSVPPGITAPLPAASQAATPAPGTPEATTPGPVTPAAGASEETTLGAPIPAPAASETTAPASKEARKRAPKPRCADKRSWYCGVSAEEQAHALELYTQGNQFFDDNLFPAAVTRYQDALLHWKHPAIHYNLMLALVALDQPIEAFQASMEALRHGVQALKLEEYRRAVDYQRLLRGQIASLEVSCDEPGAVVSLDGKEILQGPGTVHLFVRPGQHELVARKDGYLSTHHTIVTVSEKPVSLDMRLLPQAKATVPVRRWPAWQPWAVVGAGVGLGLAGGGLLDWRADVNNRLFQNSFYAHCQDNLNGGCYLGEYSSDMKSLSARRTWYRRASHGASIAGGMVALGGLVLAYLNREQQIPNPERKDLVHMSLVPTVDSDTTSLALHLSF